MTALKGQYAPNAQQETIELQQLLRLFLIAREAMKDATHQVFLILFQDRYHFILRLPTMNHQRQLPFCGPLHLRLKGQQLLFFIGPVPIKIKSYLANGNKTGIMKACFQQRELLLPIAFHRFRMQAYHRKSITFIGVAQGNDAIDGRQVNRRNEHTCHTCSFCTADYIGQIVAKFLAI